MSRNFHLLHVHAPDERQRARVVRAVLAYAKKAGFERVTRASGADRVIRLGGARPWLTIVDDGREAELLAEAVSRATKLPVLEASCEASAIVALGLHAGGKLAGAWGEGGRAPTKKLVAPLLAKGTPAELAEAFAHGLRQVFPEAALAVAAERFGLDVERMFGERAVRGTTLALRRRKAAWTPRYQGGEPAFRVGWGSNQGWGPRHLVFDGEVCEHRFQVASVGGPGRGFALRFSGSALDEGHVEIVSCKQATMALAPSGPNAWSAPCATVPAGLVERPDTFSMGRREADRARALTGALEWFVDLGYRTRKEGACELIAEVESGPGRGRGSLELMVMWRPWRPSVVGPHIDQHTLLAMHRLEHASAHLTLRGSLEEAWAWARPRLEAWAAARGDHLLRVTRAGEVLLAEDAAPHFDRVASLLPGPAMPFQVSGATYLFGTFAFAPFRMAPGDELVAQLILSSRDPACAHTETLPHLEALCDEAIRDGAAHSAILEQNQYRAGDKTRWEHVAVPGADDPLKLASWHATHLRGVDKRLWMSQAHASLLDRGALPEHVTVTDLGRGLRLQMSDDRPRADLEPLLAALGPLVPASREVERWVAERTPG